MNYKNEERELLEQIERITYKNGDELAVSIGRSMERFEEHFHERLAVLEAKLKDLRDICLSFAEAASKP
jgi:hypothetical protein